MGRHGGPRDGARAAPARARAPFDAASAARDFHPISEDFWFTAPPRNCPRPNAGTQCAAWARLRGRSVCCMRIQGSQDPATCRSGARPAGAARLPTPRSPAARTPPPALSGVPTPPPLHPTTPPPHHPTTPPPHHPTTPPPHHPTTPPPHHPTTPPPHHPTQTQPTMCFNQPITAATAAVNLATGAWLTSQGHPLATAQLCYVFFLMELLQFIQYFVVGDCGSWVNQLTTVVRSTRGCGAGRPVGSTSQEHTASGTVRCCAPTPLPLLLTHLQRPRAALLPAHLLPAGGGQRLPLPPRAQPRRCARARAPLAPRRRPRDAAAAAAVAGPAPAAGVGVGMAAGAARPAARGHAGDVRDGNHLRPPAVRDARQHARRVGAAARGGCRCSVPAFACPSLARPARRVAPN
jgi:hypothetical protein